MKHRSTPYDFKLEVLPISGGTLSALVKNGAYLDVGSLFADFIAPALYNTPLVLSRREPFTLVNVSCLHTGWSYGCLETPPKEAQPSACTWLFTFAMSAEEYNEFSEVGYTSLRWINTRVWGAKNSKFITIGIPHTQSQYLGLKYDMLTPRLAYFMVGAISKSFVRMHRYWSSNGRQDFDYEGSYNKLNLAMLHDSLYMVPMYGLISRLPYHLWVFNRHVWLQAPFLLSEKHITPTSLLYILMYIRGVEEGSLSPRVETKILDLLESSLLSTIQRAEQKTAPTGVDDCLYTALMYQNEIPDVRTLEWLITKEQSVMEFGLSSITDYREYIRTLFYA